MPATSQLDWLSSTTAMIVLFWSRATRDLLRSFGWGIAALHRLDAATKLPRPRRPPHSVYRSRSCERLIWALQIGDGDAANAIWEDFGGQRRARPRKAQEPETPGEAKYPEPQVGRCVHPAKGKAMGSHSGQALPSRAPTASCGLSDSSWDMCCGRSLLSRCSRQRDPSRSLS